MTQPLQTVFAQLRELLKEHADDFSVGQDAKDRYCLEAPAGPATLRSWRGKLKTPTIPVAWVQVGKAYVSYHLMGVYVDTKLVEQMSQLLRARMQGKSCFNFKTVDEGIVDELRKITAESLQAMRKGEYVADSASA